MRRASPRHLTNSAKSAQPSEVRVTVPATPRTGVSRFATTESADSRHGSGLIGRVDRGRLGRRQIASAVGGARSLARATAALSRNGLRCCRADQEPGHGEKDRCEHEGDE